MLLLKKATIGSRLIYSDNNDLHTRLHILVNTIIE